MAGTKTIEIAMAKPMDCIKICRLLNKSDFPYTHLDHTPLEGNFVDWVSDVISTGFVVNATMAGRLIGTMGFSFNRYKYNRLKTYYEQDWLTLLANYGGYGIEQRMMERIMKNARKNRSDVYIHSPIITEPQQVHDFKAEHTRYKFIYDIGGVHASGNRDKASEAYGCDSDSIPEQAVFQPE